MYDTFSPLAFITVLGMSVCLSVCLCFMTEMSQEFLRSLWWWCQAVMLTVCLQCKLTAVKYKCVSAVPPSNKTVVWLLMIFFFNCNWVDTRWQ